MNECYKKSKEFIEVEHTFEHLSPLIFQRFLGIDECYKQVSTYC